MTAQAQGVSTGIQLYIDPRYEKVSACCAYWGVLRELQPILLYSIVYIVYTLFDLIDLDPMTIHF